MFPDPLNPGSLRGWPIEKFPRLKLANDNKKVNLCPIKVRLLPTHKLIILTKFRMVVDLFIKSQFLVVRTFL